MVSGPAGFEPTQGLICLPQLLLDTIIKPECVFKLCCASHSLYGNGEGTSAKELLSEYL